MNKFGNSKIAVFSAALLMSLSVPAEDPTPAAGTPASDAARIDRDGKRICGFTLMSDTERGGYRNMMHQTKALEDRDAIRADHCARMRARAKERGVEAD